MYTADQAREESEKKQEEELDRRIRLSVEEAQQFGARSSSIRVYIDDPFCHTIKEELEKRGFHSVYVPNIILKGDVDFSW